jgi:flagellar hook-associated protein 3 FlgL
MRTSNISTLSVSLALRSATARMQTDLPRLQTELVTGQYADSGLALGAESRKLVSFVGEIDHVQQMIDTNSQVQTRLTASQKGMTYLGDLADGLVNAVAIVMGDTNQYPTAQQTAANTVDEIASVLNTQINGVFIFSGLNVDNQPISDYTTGPAKAAFDAAFLGFSGLTRTIRSRRADPDRYPELPDDTGRALFMGAGWTANVSAARTRLSRPAFPMA